MSEHKEQFTVGVSENVDVVVKTDANIAEPSRYNVVFLNDDYTPMDFVNEILQNIFHRALMVNNSSPADEQKKSEQY